MANKRNWLGMAVLALSFGLVLAGCGGNDATTPSSTTKTFTGTAGGKTYKLEVTDDSTYVLTVGDKKSSGMVTSSASGVYTLKPSKGSDQTFTVTASNGGISAMSGKIIFDDGTDEASPTTLTPTQPNPGGGKGLTITGLSAYNGKYAFALLFKEGYSPDFIGCASVTTAGLITGVQISGGQVKLPIHSANESFTEYSGSDTLMVNLLIFAEASVNIQEEGDDGAITGGSAEGDKSVVFSAGVATVALSNFTMWDDEDSREPVPPPGPEPAPGP